MKKRISIFLLILMFMPTGIACGGAVVDEIPFDKEIIVDDNQLIYFAALLASDGILEFDAMSENIALVNVVCESISGNVAESIAVNISDDGTARIAVTYTFENLVSFTISSEIVDSYAYIIPNSQTIKSIESANEESVYFKLDSAIYSIQKDMLLDICTDLTTRVCELTFFSPFKFSLPDAKIVIFDVTDEPLPPPLTVIVSPQ